MREGVESLTLNIVKPLLTGFRWSIGMQMIIHGKARGNGVIALELGFNPSEVFTELEKRQIFVHEKINVL